MNIKFDATYFFSSYNQLTTILNDSIVKSYPITKENGNLFELMENEVMFLKINGSKFNRAYKSRYNNKYEFLNEGRVKRNTKVTRELIDTAIHITNKYVHLIFSDHQEKIAISKINEIFITPKDVTIFLDDKAYQFIFNTVAIGLQFALLLDAIAKINVDDSFVGKTINIEIGKLKNKQVKQPVS